MTITDAAFELIARYLGIGDNNGRAELRVCLEMYADALDLEMKQVPELEPDPLPTPETNKPEKICRHADENGICAKLSDEQVKQPCIEGPCSEMTEQEYFESEPAPPVPDDRLFNSLNKGAGVTEKRGIFNKLVKFRVKHGFGCFSKLAKHTGGRINEDDFRRMIAGTPYPVSKWREVETAIKHMRRLQNECINQTPGRTGKDDRNRKHA